MLRGARKNMIVVRTRDSRVFEEAYFVMRRNSGQTAVDESAMLWEANRILESTVSHAGIEPLERPAKERRPWLRNLLWFGLGLCGGGGITGLLWFWL
jgi:hypothetical protein